MSGEQKKDAPGSPTNSAPGSPTNSAPGSPADPPPRAPAAKQPKRRRWRRRLAFAAISLVLLLVFLRFGLVLALPTILASIAKRYDLSCTYERLDLSALAGDVELWHLSVGPIEGGDPIADLEYCRADALPI